MEIDVHSYLALALMLAGAPLDDMVETERSFARHAAEKGVPDAFRTYIAEDGLMFAPDPKPGKALLRAAPQRPGGSLKWWPVFAGMSASGDLGFSTGPYVSEGPRGKAHGHFLTIWKKQGDGRWRWMIDHGTPTREPAPEGLAAKVDSLPASPAIPSSAAGAAAWSAVRQREDQLDAALATDAAAAYLAALSDDARVMRVGPQPAVGRAAYRERLENGPGTVAAAHIGGGISQAGDLAYTYGHAVWSEDETDHKGHYVRIWQRRAEGWKLVVDQLIPTPPPSPR